MQTDQWKITDDQLPTKSPIELKAHLYHVCNRRHEVLRLSNLPPTPIVLPTLYNWLNSASETLRKCGRGPGPWQPKDLDRLHTFNQEPKQPAAFSDWLLSDGAGTEIDEKHETMVTYLVLQGYPRIIFSIFHFVIVLIIIIIIISSSSFQHPLLIFPIFQESQNRPSQPWNAQKPLGVVRTSSPHTQLCNSPPLVITAWNYDWPRNIPPITGISLHPNCNFHQGCLLQDGCLLSVLQ